MKSFIFKELLLTSFVERKARKISFDPTVTVVRGNNETGKSSLLKSLFRTFGADPARVHPKWVETEVRSVVRFEIDGVAYSILRYGNSFAAFDAAGKLIGRFQSVTKGLAPFLAELFNFGLRLPSRNGTLTALPPAYYFLPFYMDQDASWASAWAGFANLGQFSNWRRSVIEYHAGIRGNDYYAAQAQKLETETDLNRVRRRQEVHREIYSGLTKRFAPAQFNVDFARYKDDVDELLKQCERLRKREEEFKAQISELQNRRQSLTGQLLIARHARDESRKDFDLATSLGGDVECPTCGAHYANSFAERFHLATDEGHCNELITELLGALEEIDRRVESEVVESTKIMNELSDIERLLARREGEVALVDLIQQEGRRELGEVMAENIGELDAEANRLAGHTESLVKEMARLDSKDRRKEVNGFYEDRMRLFLSSLDVRTVPDSAIAKVDAQIRGTGSELPRAILALQLAFFHVVARFGSAVLSPLVIDSPNQQDQDSKHLERILDFIRDHRPSKTQLILAVVDAPGVEFGGKEIHLQKKYGLLDEGEFFDVGDEVRALEDAALRG